MAIGTFLLYSYSCIWKRKAESQSHSGYSDVLLARMYKGAYYPIIHLGLGIEFQQPAIIAEALSRTAAHDDARINTLFANAEQEAAIAYPSRKPKSMLGLAHEVRATDTIRNAPQ